MEHEVRETSEIDRQVTAMQQGRAFARVPGRRIVRVTGADALGWLQDLLTADLAGLAPGHACRSLLLTPTGRIRADLWALRSTDEVVLTQGVDAGEPVETLLAPYALTSRVSLELDEGVTIVAGPADASTVVDRFVPSCVGLGADALVEVTAADALATALSDRGLVEAGPDALDRLRILRGLPRMGVDFDTSSLPAEAGLEVAIAHDKGCYLGQESVARVRNLGHPPTVIRHVGCEGPLAGGDPVVDAGAPCGVVTSASSGGDSSVALVRVAWAHRDGRLTTSDGRPLHVLQVAA